MCLNKSVVFNAFRQLTWIYIIKYSVLGLCAGKCTENAICWVGLSSQMHPVPVGKHRDILVHIQSNHHSSVSPHCPQLQISKILHVGVFTQHFEGQPRCPAESGYLEQMVAQALWRPCSSLLFTDSSSQSPSRETYCFLFSVCTLFPNY